MEDYSKFISVYANLPEKARKSVIVVIDKQPYSWNSVYAEIINNTALGKEMYSKLLKMEII